MKCPFLVAPLVNNCFANEKPYSPTSIQLEEFCEDQYFKCPFYRYSMRKNAGKMKMERRREKSLVS
jgi:hypothetical protein